MKRISIYVAERRTLDASGRVLARQESYGFSPLIARSSSTVYGTVERDAADSPRLAVCVPPTIVATLSLEAGEEWLVLSRDGRVLYAFVARDAVEAATQELLGLSLSATPEQLFSLN